MADNRPIENRPVDLTDPAQRHEKRDANVFAVTWVGIGLALTTIASFFIVLGVFRFLSVQERAVPAPTPTGVNVDARSLPPQPRLLENEPQNLQEMRTAEDRILSGYSWADQEHTKVKIPIDRAIDMLVQRGLPSRPQNGVQTADAGVTVPTEAGLGPKVQQPGGPLAGGESAPPPAPASGGKQ